MLMRPIAAILVWGALGSVMTPLGGAQTLRYPVHSMDFDIWCTEEQHIPWERCDKRLPDDVKKFEAYRAIVERYEIPYLKEKDAALRFDTEILNNDPVDKRPDNTVAQPPDPNAGR
jgi:hypothetical protein